jgi:cell division inhibitor SepF
MSGALRKMGVYLGLVEDGERYNARYDDEYDDGYDDEYDEEAVDGESEETAAVPVPDRRDEQVGTVSKFPDRRGVTATSPEVTELARITTVHPRSYNEARVIGEHFRDGTPVIMNLTEMDHADAKRLVDFAAGLIFCCRGSIERITTKVFLVCPPNVTLAAEEKEKIAADGFYNQS